MKKRLFALILLILPFTLSSELVLADKLVKNSSIVEQIEIKQLDKRAQILAAYLASYNSPLQYHAQDFVDAAKEYNLDWKLLPAIAGVESTFGKVIPGGYNAWGWGVFGTQAIYFNSWREGIFTVSKGLRENYIDKGYTEPDSMNRIYATSPYWGFKVTYFMQDLERFTQKYQAKSEPMADVVISSIKIAAISGKLAFRQTPGYNSPYETDPGNPGW